MNFLPPPIISSDRQQGHPHLAVIPGNENLLETQNGGHLLDIMFRNSLKHLKLLRRFINNIQVFKSTRNNSDDFLTAAPFSIRGLRRHGVKNEQKDKPKKEKKWFPH